ncbi:MAG: hypothetical protein KDA45_14735 [Planctomycetales bacterium]|nr:hypothetical protein [Planctomycetales bacterium]MCA9239867.1 hypothetical protein [Planctomycetales bacterium]
MSPTLTTFLFEAANFLVLAAALGYVFFTPVRRALQQRRAQSEEQARAAAEKLAAAEQARQDIEQARRNLQQELDQRRAEAIEQSHREADRLLSDARAAAERESELMRRQAAQMSLAEHDRLARAVAAAAAKTVGQLLRQIHSTELETALIQEASQQLSRLPQESLAPLKIESSHDLSEEQRQVIRAALGAAAERAEYRTVEDLGSGIRITTSTGLIDATTSGLSKYAGQALSQELNGRRHPLPAAERSLSGPQSSPGVTHD